MKQDKVYICKDSECSNTFKKHKSTDKYCSHTCASKNTNPLKRTELKRIPLKLSQKSIDKIKAKTQTPTKKSIFQVEFEKQSRKIKKRIVEQYGEIRCEKCKANSSIQFSTHHIIYRSERPKHPAINALENLIHLCFDCHEWFHKSKTNRNPWITTRKLYLLFGRIWGYDNNE
jgi:predicted HNH restriction endonuclease